MGMHGSGRDRSAGGLQNAVTREIRIALARCGWSTADLARRMAVPDKWLGGRMRGDTRMTLVDLGRVAEALGVAAVDLVPVVDLVPAGAPETAVRRPQPARPSRPAHSRRAPRKRPGAARSAA